MRRAKANRVFFLRLLKKKQFRSNDRAVRKLRHLKPNPDGSSVDRFGRAALERSFFSWLRFWKALAPLSCTGCFRDFCVADQSPSLDKFYRSGAGTPEARAGSRGRGISTHARYVRPDIPVDRSVSPLVEHGAGALGLPAQDPAGSRPAGRSSPLIASPREERRVTRIALAARAARRLPGPARSGGSRPDPDRSTSD